MALQVIKLKGGLCCYVQCSLFKVFMIWLYIYLKKKKCEPRKKYLFYSLTIPSKYVCKCIYTAYYYERGKSNTTVFKYASSYV